MRPVDVGARGQRIAVEELALARALEECLEAMEQGETDLDALAGRYPLPVKEEIRSLLDIAALLRSRRRAEAAPLDLLRRLDARLGGKAAFP